MKGWKAMNQKGRPIMIQGTMSNAGKSLLCAGLLRVFSQDGFRCAPFKAQNMALNSFITPDGLEIGRAQAVQAEAAGIKPSADMNPVLLKPSSMTGSQIVVRGVPLCDMPAREYFAYKKELMPLVLESYERLREQYDIIVIEGAGSPAEINLKKDDIVNMGLAKRVNAPVLLAGDIDCGGVFAQLYGTVKLLPEDEQALIKGLIINKFRGDPSILAPGVGMLEELTGKPVAGVVPFLDVDIDDEDSLSSRLGIRESEGDLVDIAVIHYPYLSNFTDFHALEKAGGAQVRYVSRLKELKMPDLVILPGTKNTMEAMNWLEKSGIGDKVKELNQKGTPVIGICGGYQLLGKTLSDPEGTEGGAAGAVREALGLLPVETVFTKTKETILKKAVFRELSGFYSFLSGIPAEGYEVHMGRTQAVRETGSPLLTTEDGTAAGWISGTVFGSYLHGIFDAPGIADALILALGKKRFGEDYAKEKKVDSFDYAAYREKQYDILADGLRKALDMDFIYGLLGVEKA